jgi:hypothetical protein
MERTGFAAIFLFVYWIPASLGMAQVYQEA